MQIIFCKIKGDNSDNGYIYLKVLLQQIYKQFLSLYKKVIYCSKHIQRTLEVKPESTILKVVFKQMLN